MWYFHRIHDVRWSHSPPITLSFTFMPLSCFLSISFHISIFNCRFSHMIKNMWYLFFWLWLISCNMMIFSFFHLSVNVQSKILTGCVQKMIATVTFFFSFYRTWTFRLNWSSGLILAKQLEFIRVSQHVWWLFLCKLNMKWINNFNIFILFLLNYLFQGLKPRFIFFFKKTNACGDYAY
jgi:hypothetical protein